MGRVTSLAFHDIKEKEVDSDFDVLQSDLLDIVERITTSGLICSDDLVLYFDDGYESIWHHRKMLSSLGVTIKLGIISSRVDNVGYLSSNKLQKLSKHMTICSHSVTHPAFSHFDLSLQKNEKRVLSELVNSKSFIENIINHDIKEFILPYGSYNRAIKKLLMEKRIYSHIATCDIGVGNKDYFIPRIIYSNGRSNQSYVDYVEYIYSNLARV